MDQKNCDTTIADYERIFHPQKLAIVGVSEEGTGFGSGMFNALQAMGFEGEIFPVNPKGAKRCRMFWRLAEKMVRRVQKSFQLVSVNLERRKALNWKRRSGK